MAEGDSRGKSGATPSGPGKTDRAGKTIRRTGPDQQKAGLDGAGRTRTDPVRLGRPGGLNWTAGRSGKTTRIGRDGARGPDRAKQAGRTGRPGWTGRDKKSLADRPAGRGQAYRANLNKLNADQKNGSVTDPGLGRALENLSIPSCSPSNRLSHVTFPSGVRLDPIKQIGLYGDPVQDLPVFLVVIDRLEKPIVIELRLEPELDYGFISHSICPLSYVYSTQPEDESWHHAARTDLYGFLSFSNNESMYTFI